MIELIWRIRFYELEMRMLKKSSCNNSKVYRIIKHSQFVGHLFSNRSVNLSSVSGEENLYFVNSACVMNKLMTNIKNGNL